MSQTVTCSNPRCRTTINTEGKEVGQVVRCPKCGTENQVLAQFGSAFDLSGLTPPEGGNTVRHPARQVCENCGAVLGVRASICPKCHADVRTGAAIVNVGNERPRRNMKPLIIVGAVLGIAIVAALIVVLVLARR